MSPTQRRGPPGEPQRPRYDRRPIMKQIAVAERTWGNFGFATGGWRAKRKRRRREDKRTPGAKVQGREARWREGDFILVARISHKKGEKISVRWRGPYKITKPISQWVYEVQELGTESRMRVHATRLKYYCEKARGNEEELAALAQEQKEEWPVKSIESFYKNTTTGAWEIEVAWDDAEEEHERTYEPLENIAVDVPTMVIKAYNRRSTVKSPELKAALESVIPKKYWKA
eukprot:GHVU01017450.1.p1 GENE.GHVU01017450.1~~GHVU01017450.1.p1  ORF type:complete len:230 (-),score=35.15 GHVU01017450.1:111-800(-)